MQNDDHRQVLGQAPVREIATGPERYSQDNQKTVQQVRVAQAIIGQASGSEPTRKESTQEPHKR